MNRICIVIFLVAFAVRFSSTLRHPPAPDNGYESTRVAISLAGHGTFADPFPIPTGPTAHVAPGFPLVLSVIYRAFGTGPAGEIAKRFLNCAVSSLQYAFLPYLAVTLGLAREVGLTAAILGALVPLQRYAESESSWESSWAALLLMPLVAMSSGGVRWGAVWGSALLFAPSLASVYAAFLFLRRRPYRLAVMSVLVSALFLLPWAYRNHRNLGSWIWFRDNLGLELSVSNQDGAQPRLDENLRSGNHGNAHPHGNPLEAQKVKTLGEVEYNRRRMRQALSWIRSHPLRFAELTAARICYFWFPWVASIPLRVLLAVITILAFAGLVKTRKSNPATAQLIGAIWIFFPIIYYLVEFDRRYRHPMEWTILLMAVQGACRAKRKAL